MEDYRNKSSGKRKRKIKGDVRRNYDASSFKNAYLKVVKGPFIRHLRNMAYHGLLRRGTPIANHGGENSSNTGDNRETASPAVSSLLSVPDVPQTPNDTRRPKRNPQTRYLTPQNINNFDSEEENIVFVPNETTVPVASKETVISASRPPDSPTQGPSTEISLKRKLPRVKREKKQANESTMCDYCGVHYSQDVALRNGAVWVECMNCSKWYHQECTGTESLQFLCDNCDTGDFSGSDDRDWAPE